MKLFHFYRIEDATGVSGTGPVVEGVQFSNGWCAIRWISQMSSLCFYQSLDEVKRIHGHGGRTEIVVHDLEPLGKRVWVSAQANEKFEIWMEVMEEAARAASLAEHRASTAADQRSSIGLIRELLERLENLAR